MRRINILAILPYEGMREIMSAAANEHSEISLYAFVGDLAEGIEIAKQEMSVTDYDILIARGGTAELLRKEFHDTPVLEIMTSFEDILHTIRLARNYQEKFAVVSFPTIASRAKGLCDLLQYDIEVHTIYSSQEVRPLLKEMQKAGYTMVVGDMVTTTVAKSIGLNTILITSGKDSIESVLDQAKMLFSVQNKTSFERNRLNWALRTIPIYVTIFNEDGEIILSNVEKTEKTETYFSLIKSRFPKLLQNITMHMDRQVGSVIFSIDSVSRIIDGKKEVAVYGRSIFHEVPVEKGGISLIEDKDDDNYAFESPFGMTSSVGQTHETILKYCESMLPVLILGEQGTGKDTAANMIHRSGQNNGRPYYIINCSLVTDKEWNSFLESPSSPLSDVNCTVYFKNIHAISSANEKKLQDLIEQTNLCKRNRVIFSAVVKGDETKCSMAEYILNKVNCLLLQSLPLRRRTEDISSLSAIYLNNLNSEFGKQIIGFEPGVEDILLRFPWPGNIPQFKRVLRELVIRTNTYYITKENVASCIQNEIFTYDEKVTSNINLNQTLDDIMYDVLRMVLKQENMNHKKTAERLNISRSTIWRILKAHKE